MDSGSGASTLRQCPARSVAGAASTPDADPAAAFAMQHPPLLGIHQLGCLDDDADFAERFAEVLGDLGDYDDADFAAVPADTLLRRWSLRRRRKQHSKQHFECTAGDLKFKGDYVECTAAQCTTGDLKSKQHLGMEQCNLGMGNRKVDS